MEWDEEVELQPGASIWVHRTDRFESRSEPGNPLRTTWWITSRAIAFSWAGRPYTFSTDATSILMLRPAGDAGMTIVAWTTRCAKPGYVEYRWSGDGWKLQPRVSPELIGQPRNLTGFYSALGELPARVSLDFKRSAGFDLPQRGEQDPVLAAARTANNCPGGN